MYGDDALQLSEDWTMKVDTRTHNIRLGSCACSRITSGPCTARGCHLDKYCFAELLEDFDDSGHVELYRK
eukprot:4609614-Amphidinium_carterae.1